MTYEDFVRDEDEGLKGLMAQLYPDRPGGRVEILNSRKPSDIVKRSNAQVKKMVTNVEEVEGWFAEWGGPAPLWRMFHDDGTTAFAPIDGTGQAACDHFLDICERKMGLSTCLKLEKFTMGSSN